MANQFVEITQRVNDKMVGARTKAILENVPACTPQLAAMMMQDPKVKAKIESAFGGDHALFEEWLKKVGD